jgi:hypothetical protein
MPTTEDLKSAEAAMRECCNLIAEGLFSTAIPSRLWHYTDTHGFTGIMHSGQFHFGNIRFLNDSQEFLHAISIMRKGATEFRKVHQEPEARFILDLFLDEISIVNEQFVPSIYVCCFSAAENDLSQWRGYGGTLGVSIGFDATDVASQFGNAQLRPCTYDIEKQLRTLYTLLGNMVMVYLRHGPKVAETDEQSRKDWALKIINTFLIYTVAA